MGKNIIKTSLSRRLNLPALAIVSFLFPGLGQIMAGQASKGIILFAARTLAVILPAAAVASAGNTSGPGVFVFSVVAAFFITLVSPLMIFLRSEIRKPLSLRSYNRLPVYIIFAIINIGATLAAVLLLFSVFSFHTVESQALTPVVKKNETLLVAGISSGIIKRGDLVLTEEFEIIRIIALPGDSVEMANNHFYINGTSNSAGILSPDEHRALGVGYYEGVYAEYGDGVKYPVIYDRRRSVSAEKIVNSEKPQFLGADDVRYEDVFYREISAESIKGRIEGVLIPENLNRLFVRPYVLSRFYLE